MSSPTVSENCRQMDIKIEEVSDVMLLFGSIVDNRYNHIFICLRNIYHIKLVILVVE